MLAVSSCRKDTKVSPSFNSKESAFCSLRPSISPSTVLAGVSAGKREVSTPSQITARERLVGAPVSAFQVYGDVHLAIVGLAQSEVVGL